VAAIIRRLQAHLAAWQGKVYDVDFVYRQHHRDRILV
jgi:hypothetical protein